MYETNLIQQRDEHLQQLHLKYINYINALLHQKLLILTNIQKQYDEKINIIRNKYDDIKVKQLKKIITFNNSIQHIQTDSSIKSSKQRKPTNNNNNNNFSSFLPSLTSPEPNPFANESEKTPSIAISPTTPFIPHLTMNEANKLRVNDKIDHRDFVGCFNEAIIIDKKKTNLKIHYFNWGYQWDVWCDYDNELHNLALYKSISNRKKHNHFHLKKGDYVYVNPLKDKGWKIAEILDFDDKSGQIKTGYQLNQEIKYWWIHLDNINEIALMSTDSTSMINNTSGFGSGYRSSSDSYSYYCIYCLFEFKDYNDLRSHIINKHTERPNICDKCPESFYSKSLFESHQAHHNENLSNFLKYKCDLCIKYFNCKRSFVSAEALSAHIYQTHKRIPIKTTLKSISNYYCIYCSDLLFNTYYELRYHLNVFHVKERPFICAYCPQTFTTFNALVQHSNQHIINGYYKCNLCITYFNSKTSFISSGSLTAHKSKVHKNLIKNNKKRKTPAINTNKKGKRKGKGPKAKKIKLTQAAIHYYNKIYVSKHKLWKLWKWKEKQIKLDNKEITKRYQINRLLKQGFKEFILTNNLCKEWLSKWDDYTLNHLEDDVLFNICIKDKPLLH